MDVENDTMERGKDGRVNSSVLTSRRGRRVDGAKARGTTLMVTSGMYALTMSFSTSSHERLAVQVIP